MTDAPQPITEIAALEALYDSPSAAALDKVATRLTPLYRKWIEASRFCILTTAGPEGTDGSPRGDDGPVVTVADEATLLMPDWRGNNRMDSLRNIVRDGRVSLMFMVPGSTNVVRVNGRAVVTADAGLRARFARGGLLPRSVIVVTLAEVYIQCTRAILRAGLWTAGDESAGLPRTGEILTEVTGGAFDGTAYEAARAGRTAETMW